MSTEERKSQLRKLANLDNAKANDYLSSFASELINDIKKSNNNESILHNLNLLGEFAFRVPEKVLDVTRFIISSKLIQPSVFKVDDVAYEGKSHRDLLLAILDLLDRLRYMTTNDVLVLTAQLSLHEEKVVRDRALKVVEELSKYDLHVLPKIGYTVQREIADFMLAWTIEEKILHIDFIEIAANELLSSSVGSTEMTAADTFTMRYGQVAPTDFLKKIRRDVLNLVYELFNATHDIKIKLDLVRTLDTVTQPPHNVEMSTELIQMMKEDSEYLLDIYRKMIAEGNLAIMNHIEQRLYWMNIREKNKIDKSDEMRKEILHNDLYSLFRILVRSDSDFREEGSWQEAQKKHDEKIKKLVDSMNQPSLGIWEEKLNKVAEQKNLIDEWKYLYFENFIIELTLAKPKLADALFSDALVKKLPLKNFIVGFFLGIRISSKFEMWDIYADKIIREKDIEYLKPLIHSLCLSKDVVLEKSIRDKDLELLESMVKQVGVFGFLKGVNDDNLHYTIIETILRNLKRSPKKMESVIINEITINPRYMEMFLRQLPLAIAREWLSVKEFQSETKKILLKALIEVPDLSWDMQRILLDIGQCEGIDVVLNVILQRINMDVELKKKKAKSSRRYDAIPFHWNPELKEFISQNKKYNQIVSEWIAGMTQKWSLYNWHLSDFLQSIGSDFADIIMSLVNKGDNDSLKKAATIMHSFEGANIDLSIEIVRKTDDKEILSQVASNINATGVMSGEYGIAIAFENKAKELEKFKEDKSERVRKFVTDMIKSLNEDAAKERKRADEEKQLRRIEFESNN